MPLFPSLSPGANTFTATQTITPAANTPAITISGFSLTGSNASSAISIAGTWNTSGNTTAILVDITDTASGASSNLMDLRTGATSRFRVTKSGRVIGIENVFAGAATAIPAGGSASVRFGLTSSFISVYAGSGAPTVSAPQGSLYLRSDGTTTNDRAYINTDGNTTWTPLVTVG